MDDDDDNNDDDDVEYNFECPSLGPSTFLIKHFQILEINLLSTIKSTMYYAHTEQL